MWAKSYKGLGDQLKIESPLNIGQCRARLDLDPREQVLGRKKREHLCSRVKGM